MIQPASKGPFVANGYYVHDATGRRVTSFCGDGTTDDDDIANARYFAHAANVLPKLERALSAACKFVEQATEGEPTMNTENASKALALVYAALAAIDAADKE